MIPAVIFSLSLIFTIIFITASTILIIDYMFEVYRVYKSTVYKVENVKVSKFMEKTFYVSIISMVLTVISWTLVFYLLVNDSNIETWTGH